ncbi:MAG: hypothetical protein ACI8PZ_005529 [Myxococcota bacterium]|jgi:hypothetical protein
MKECASCGASVPRSANLCKHCFHDFTEDSVPTRSGGPIFLLGAVAAMAVLGALTLGYVASQPIEERILVDQDTRSVVWTRQYRSGIQTERLPWDQIAGLEYIIRGDGDFEIAAVASGGARHIIHADTSPLKAEAEKYAQLMKKELKEVDKTRGFHKMGDE